jgi:hypothetical protein
MTFDLSIINAETRRRNPGLVELEAEKPKPEIIERDGYLFSLNGRGKGCGSLSELKEWDSFLSVLWYTGKIEKPKHQTLITLIEKPKVTYRIDWIYYNFELNKRVWLDTKVKYKNGRWGYARESINKLKEIKAMYPKDIVKYGNSWQGYKEVK